MGVERKVIGIAGPNGAGKTTFAREFLPHEAGCPVFINADLIAAGLAPFVPDTAVVRAGRLYAPLVDDWVLYENAGAAPVLLDWSEKP